MNAGPIVKSKIIVPRLPGGTLVTDRIKGLGIERSRVVSVAAPAGYGKTTAILAALRNSTGIHWYRLEKEDARLPIFYGHLIESLFGRLKKPEPESLKFFWSITDLSQGYELLNAAICQDVWTIYGDRGHRRRYIVFDDFHHVMDNPQIVETLRYFIANLPENLHIIISSRKDTGIFDGSAGLRKDIRFISEKELSFSEEEIALYLKERADLSLPPGTLAKFCQKTEGWISGVVLIGNLISRTGPQNIETYFESGAEKNDIFKYFLSEGLGGLPPAGLRSIAVMATMEEFSISDIETAFGIPDAAEIIDYCEKMNLFIQKTVTDTTIFRFHSLFRGSLLALRGTFFTVREIEALNVKASDYYLERGEYVKAIRHMLLAHRMEEVVRLLCVYGRNLLFTGQGEHLKMLIEELPGQLVEQNPYLSFFYGFSIISSEFDRSCSYLKNSMRLFEQQGNTDMQVQVMAALFTAFAQRNDVSMIRKLVADCERLDEKIKSDEVRGTLLACRLGRAAFDEDFEEGLELSREIENYQLDDMWRYGINNFRCMIHYRLGDLEKARRIIEENYKMPLVQRNDQYKILYLVFCHTIALYMNDVEWSAWIRTELLNLGEKYSSGYGLGFGKKDAAVARYLDHDIDSAIELINASARHFQSYHNDAQVHRSVMFRNLWLLERNPGLVKLDEVMEALEYLVTVPAGQGFAETAQSIAGVILRESGDCRRAEELLLASYATSRGKKTLQTVAGTAMHLAKLHYDQGDQEKGDGYLKEFIAIASERGFVNFYDLHLPTLVEMSARCVVKDMHSEYAAALVERYYGEKAARQLAANPVSLCSPEAVKSFVSRYGAARTGRGTIRISLLGDFQVIVGDSPIEDSEWKTRKAQRILKYLILNRDQFVAKERLAELFWPGTGRKAAMASLNVALYELRQVLSRYGAAPEDEFPLVHDRMDGFEVKSSERLEVDTDEFLKLYQQYRLYESRGGDTRPLLQEMIRHYAGDLLPQDLYEDWTLLEREHLRSKYLEAAHRLAQLYDKEGAYDEEEALLVKTLVVDPYDETACTMLVNLYQSTGRKGMARKLSRSFARRMEKDLGSKLS